MTQSAKSRKDAKRARRQAAIATRQQTQRRRDVERRRRSWMVYGGTAAAVIIVVGLVAWSSVRSRSGVREVPGSMETRSASATPGRPAASPAVPGSAQSPAGTAASGAPAPAAVPQLVVQRYPDQGQAHIALGSSHPAYNSNPPTSGWHTPQDARWGSHRDVLPDEVVVHNLEHGGIWISYKDANDTALVEKLEALASRYRSKVIVTPRPANDAPIAVAAWTKLMKLQAFDEAAIVRFIEAYKNKGPEQVPD